MSIVLFIVILLVLVLAHEFGHFIIAKRAGIRVDEFAFGFPPRLFAKKFGETTYAFNALPLGGYVKIYGENPDDVQGEDRARSFAAQPRIVQGTVVLAGIVFNLLLAWLLISATLMIGIPASVDPGAGYVVTSPRLMVTDTHPGGPAAISGLEAGDVLVRVSDGGDTVNATSPDVVANFIGPRDGKSVTVTYERGGVEHALTMVPKQGIAPSGAAIGIYMDMVGTLRYPFIKAFSEGFGKTYEYTTLTVVGLYDFFKGIVTGHSDLSQVSGPVGIVQAVGQAAGLGLANVLLFTALISINLAVINVIPFPALDGGRLLFIIIEGIMRRPIPTKIANYANITGFALLILLMIVVTYHDVAKLIHG